MKPSTAQAAYAYNAQSDSGVILVRGWFTLIPGESTSVYGEWHFTPAGDSIGFGPQIGDGIFTGSLRGGTLEIDLNPLYVDNNVILSGTSTDSGYAGSWTWVTIAGPWRQGTFIAIRR